MNVRKLLFQIHLWVGLSLGILFVLIGLSGTGLMFRTIPGIGQAVSDVRATATGAALPLEQLAAAARASTEVPRTATTTIILPKAPGDPAAVRFVQAPPAPAGEGPRREGGEGAQAGPPQRIVPIPDVLLDPVSGQVLGTRTVGMTPLMRFFHDLHGQLFMGRTGRLVVGWMGVGMTFLGLSGLYLWWPKAHQWKTAFIVRRKAKGLRFHRELHAAVGIWSFVIFIIVSFTGVAIVFPQTVRAGFGLVVAGGDVPPALVQRGGPRAPAVEAIPGASRIDADAAVALVRQSSLENASLIQSVTIPARRNQALTVTVGEGRGTPVYVDPYQARVIPSAAPRPQTALDRLMVLLRPLHQGDGLGSIYWVLVLLSGFLPALFVFTGVVMWAKKRRQRIPMNAPLAEEAA